MGLIDSLKNALFEVEYVEVNSKDEKKETKPEKKKQEKEELDKPIAKKVILPHHKREKNNNIEREVITEEPQQIIEEPKRSEPEVVRDEPVVEPKRHSDFKIMDDNDFRVDDYYNTPVMEEPPKKKAPIEEDYRSIMEPPKKEERIIYRQPEEPVREKSPYGIDQSNKNLVPEYGGRAYEKKEANTGFKPSPIISPIYGVLDKNYKKEDVKEKREVRTATSYSRENINVDDVRNKAYGVAEISPRNSRQKTKEEKNLVIEEDEDDSNLLVDLSKDTDKPSIKEVTMGDAMEYFNDLGLEYNVDYMDAAKVNTSSRRVKDSYDDEPELFAISDEVVAEPVKQTRVSRSSASESKPPVVNNLDVESDNDDNLFDLIDSMYDEK